MRQPRVLAAVVVAIALGGAIVAAGGSGEERSAGDGLGWQGRPLLVSPPNLPRDGIVTGQVRNETLRKMRLDASELVVVDDRGRRWRTSGRFLAGFAHGLWPPGQQVAVGSDAERERVGEIATLEPGEAAPLTVAWRRPRGGGRPVRIELGRLMLPVPAAAPAV